MMHGSRRVQHSIISGCYGSTANPLPRVPCLQQNAKYSSSFRINQHSFGQRTSQGLWQYFAVSASLLFMSFVIHKRMKVTVEAQAQRPMTSVLTSKDLQGGSTERRLLIIAFDSRNSLHQEFFLRNLHAKQIPQRVQAMFPDLQIVYHDVAIEQSESNSAADLNQIYPIKKISEKHRPTFLVRANDSISCLSPDSLSTDFETKFKSEMQRRVDGFSQIQTEGELMQALKSGNTRADDVTIVHCRAPETDSRMTDLAHRILSHQSRNALLEVCDMEVAERINMKPGKFYIFYKPSICIEQREQNQERGVNQEYLQVFQGLARTELDLNVDEAEKHQNVLVNSEKAGQLLPRVFTDDGSVTFLLNPNMRKLTRLLKGVEKSEKPIIFVYMDQMYMLAYQQDYLNALSPHLDAFDIFYSSDAQDIKKLFTVKEIPHPQISFVAVIDPSNHVKVKHAQQDAAPESQAYMHKVCSQVMYPDKAADKIKKLVDNVIDETQEQCYQCQRRPVQSKVNRVTAKEFQRDFVENPRSPSHCILEVSDYHCNHCQHNKPAFSALSQKMDKEGFLSEMPLYNVQMSDRLPYVGEIRGTPTYFYISKEAGATTVKEVTRLASQPISTQFVSQVTSKSGLSHMKDRVQLDGGHQYLAWLTMESAREDWDFDYDALKVQSVYDRVQKNIGPIFAKQQEENQ